MRGEDKLKGADEESADDITNNQSEQPQQSFPAAPAILNLETPLQTQNLQSFASAAADSTTRPTPRENGHIWRYLQLAQYVNQIASTLAADPRRLLPGWAERLRENADRVVHLMDPDPLLSHRQNALEADQILQTSYNLLHMANYSQNDFPLVILPSSTSASDSLSTPSPYNPTVPSQPPQPPNAPSILLPTSSFLFPAPQLQHHQQQKLHHQQKQLQQLHHQQHQQQRPNHHASFNQNTPNNSRRLRGNQQRNNRRSRNFRVNSAPPRCQSCGATETPEWRRGPLGPRTLCNACGLIYAKLRSTTSPTENAPVSPLTAKVGDTAKQEQAEQAGEKETFQTIDKSDGQCSSVTDSPPSSGSDSNNSSNSGERKKLRLSHLLC